MTRRDILWLLASSARAQQSSGMATRGVASQPRGKVSGLPFHAKFTDVAARAGLREPVISDIFWVTGSVFPEVEKVHPDYPYKTPRVLFRNLGNGKFEEPTAAAGPAISEAHSNLEIRWPNGLVESVKAAAADRLITVREGEGVVKIESLGGPSQRGL